MIKHEARNMPNRARTKIRRCTIFGPWADENHICLPFRRGVYNLKFRIPLAQQGLCFRQAFESRPQNVIGSFLFRRQHFLDDRLAMDRRSPEAFPGPIDISSRPSVHHCQQADSQRLGRVKHPCGTAHRVGIGAIQAAKNFHHLLLSQIGSQAQPDGAGTREQHQRRHDNSHLEVVQSGNIKPPLPQNEQP